MKINIESIIDKSPNIIIALVFLLFIYVLYNFGEQVDDNRQYIGRKYIYHKDTITITSSGLEMFWTDKNMELHKSMIDRLKEVKP